VGILAVLDGRSLLDDAGRLRLGDVRDEIDGRVARVHELHRVVFHPGPLAGGPLWVEDSAFRIDHQVSELDVPPPGDDAAMRSLVERLMARPLDRARPLWRMWFLTGPPDGRVAVLVVLHHALADGLTAMRIVRSLLEPPMTDAAPRRPETRVPPIPPSWSELALDNLRSKIGATARLVRPATWQRIAEIVGSVWQTGSLARHAPRTSLNAPVGPRRRLATVRLDLAVVKRVAHVHACGVNDVVLSLVAGGVGALLDARGEPVQDLRPRVGIAVALFSRGHRREAGNDIGSLLVPLPIGEPDPTARLPLIAAETALAKRTQVASAEPVLRASVGRLGVIRRAMERQRLVNLAETYLPGPPLRIDALGAPVLDLLPLAPLAGNLGLSFVALSYAGRLTVTVRADADQFPDLDVLIVAMERDWQALLRSLESAGQAA
jgi:WS/DGAT/MGAT family acyltransferase